MWQKQTINTVYTTFDVALNSKVVKNISHLYCKLYYVKAVIKVQWRSTLFIKPVSEPVCLHCYPSSRPNHSSRTLGPHVALPPATLFCCGCSAEQQDRRCYVTPFLCFGAWAPINVRLFVNSPLLVSSPASGSLKSFYFGQLQTATSAELSC